MQEALKTKEVSDRLGIAPRTVRKWIKDFNIPCEKNDNGHYLINEEVLERLFEVKKHHREERVVEEAIRIEPKQDVIPTSSWISLVKKLTDRIEDLERQIGQKADDVVSFQVLQHRSEIEDVMKSLAKIEERIEKLESQGDAITFEAESAAAKHDKKKWLTNFLSF